MQQQQRNNPGRGGRKGPRASQGGPFKGDKQEARKGKMRTVGASRKNRQTTNLKRFGKSGGGTEGAPQGRGKPALAKREVLGEALEPGKPGEEGKGKPNKPGFGNCNPQQRKGPPGPGSAAVNQ